MATKTKTTKGVSLDRVVQLSIFTPNRLGTLHQLVRTFSIHGVHVLAMMVLDTTDSAIIRLVVDDPDEARKVFAQQAFPYTECELVVVEVTSDDLDRLMAVLLEAEININYLYSFIPHPQGRTILALSMEDNEMAEHVLTSHGFRTLRQADITR